MSSKNAITPNRFQPSTVCSKTHSTRPDPQTEPRSDFANKEKEKMETAKLTIVTDTPPPKIIVEKMLEAEAHPPINRIVALATRRRQSRHLDVDGILARSLPKVAEVSRGPHKLVKISL